MLEPDVWQIEYPLDSKLRTVDLRPTRERL